VGLSRTGLDIGKMSVMISKEVQSIGDGKSVRDGQGLTYITDENIYRPVQNISPQQTVDSLRTAYIGNTL
jgi:hypothetical protein